MKKRNKKYIGMVNGNVVYKWAGSVDEFKRLCMREAMEKQGRFCITDVRPAQSVKRIAS